MCSEECTGMMSNYAEGQAVGPYGLPLCAVPSTRHRSLLKSYLMNVGRGRKAVCAMIVGDIRRHIDLGALERACDLLLVLRLFHAECPEGMCAV
jgi:hypothetical protein